MKSRTESEIKQRVQRRIIACSVLLMGGKFLAFALTNSVGILTDAMESIVNVIAGFISLYSLYRAAKPKDENHPFGHGKIELISASVEGLLIAVAGGIIIFEGVRRLFEPAAIEKLDIGIVLVAAAGAVNYLLGRYSIRTGRRYDSIALVAGGRHLQSDTYSSIGLVAGLLLLYVTRIGWIDSALALIFGGIIVWTGFSILRKTVANLTDEADREYLKKMRTTIAENPHPDWIDIHNLKMIQYGCRGITTSVRDTGPAPNCGKPSKKDSPTGCCCRFTPIRATKNTVATAPSATARTAANGLRLH